MARKFKFLGGSKTEPANNTSPDTSAPAQVSQQTVPAANLPEFQVVAGVLKKYNGTDEDITIPNDLGVKSIGQRAFFKCSTIKKIKLPSSVTSIANYAFSNCENLTHISIPSSVSSMGNYAFENCKSLQGISLPDALSAVGNYLFSGCKSLTSVTLSENLRTVSNYMFFKCESLEDIVIPDKVAGIGWKAFSGCSSLKKIVFSNRLNTIGNYAFENCSSLTEIDLSDNVTNIGEGVFFLCEQLEKINLSSNNINLVLDNGILYNKEKTILYVYPSKLKGATSFEIPSTVTTISYGAFSNCVSLSDITIPSTVTTIENYAFFNCAKLSKLIIPESVNSIGKNAFYKCINMREITLPASINKIESGMFSGCESLESLKLPNAVTSIGEFAFFGCHALNKIKFSSNINTIGRAAFSNCNSLTEINIPDTITNIDKGVFSHCDKLNSINISDNNASYSSENGVMYNKQKNYLYNYPSGRVDKEFIIPDSVTRILDQAFFGANNLVKLTIPATATNIGTSAFSDCAKLTTVHIEQGVTNIGTFAFSKCVALKDVFIPDSVTYIDTSAFAECNNICIHCSDDSFASKYAAENSIIIAQDKKGEKVDEKPIEKDIKITVDKVIDKNADKSVNKDIDKNKDNVSKEIKENITNQPINNDTTNSNTDNKFNNTINGKDIDNSKISKTINPSTGNKSIAKAVDESKNQNTVIRFKPIVEGANDALKNSKHISQPVIKKDNVFSSEKSPEENIETDVKEELTKESNLNKASALKKDQDIKNDNTSKKDNVTKNDNTLKSDVLSNNEVNVKKNNNQKKDNESKKDNDLKKDNKEKKDDTSQLQASVDKVIAENIDNNDVIKEKESSSYTDNNQADSSKKGFSIFKGKKSNNKIPASDAALPPKDEKNPQIQDSQLYDLQYDNSNLSSEIYYDNSGFYDGNGNFVSNGYYDEYGNFVSGGYYDINGSFIANGYYDVNGNFIPTFYFDINGNYIADCYYDINGNFVSSGYYQLAGFYYDPSQVDYTNGLPVQDNNAIYYNDTYPSNDNTDVNSYSHQVPYNDMFSSDTVDSSTDVVAMVDNVTSDTKDKETIDNHIDSIKTKEKDSKDKAIKDKKDLKDKDLNLKDVKDKDTKDIVSNVDVDKEVKDTAPTFNDSSTKQKDSKETLSINFTSSNEDNKTNNIVNNNESKKSISNSNNNNDIRNTIINEDLIKDPTVASEKSAQKLNAKLYSQRIKDTTDAGVMRRISNLTTTPNTTNSLFLNWDDYPGTIEYHLLKLNKATLEFNEVSRVKTNKALITGIIPSVEEEYKLMAYHMVNNEKVPCASSKPIKISITLPPVTGFKCVSVTQSTISLTWDECKDAIGYKIYAYKQLDKKFLPVEDCSKNSITLSGLRGGTTLRLVVVAEKMINKVKCETSFSEELFATTDMAPVSGIIMASHSSTTIKLNWISISGVSEYKIYIYNPTTDNYEFLQSTKENHVIFEGLTPNCEYKYRIRACKIISGKEYLGPPSAVIKADTFA